MANVCVNRLFVSAPTAACERLLADIGTPSPGRDSFGFSFAVLVPEPDSETSAPDVLSPSRSRWRRDHWGTTGDPLVARKRGDVTAGGVDFEFETPDPPLAWVAALAAAHPSADVRLLFDCPDERRAGEVSYADGAERRRTEIPSGGYEQWAGDAAEIGIYGEHRPPYIDLKLE